ncbi:hypothetical protein D7Z26_01110 [Cohnella endophytica]|uniref:LSM domain-containing protein n=1 Tax=Cohnella endophytica TaxID=2419778 RepID=A0A494Y7R9_9BACL|nr:hypothetical protein [Cohnella endophytica]RKP58133.1 hypothetical protein D7Z26_01110 [Cohnella endophytica]
MDEMFSLCTKHLNRRVRVHTRCGDYYEGVIVNVDRDNVYLRTSGDVLTLGKAQTSAWGGYGYGYGYGGGILALSLFTLLAIALI